MRQALATFLLTLAVLLMPFGMAAPATATSATPAPAASHDAPHAAAMAMGHCPDQGNGSDAKGGIGGCTMACAAALPAIGAVAEARLLFVAAASLRTPAQRLAGLHPEAAIPPPRRA